MSNEQDDFEGYVSEDHEFKLWLKKHSNRLMSYTAGEIAQVALACGFSLEIVCPQVCDRIVKNKRMINFAESPLAENWANVKAYQNSGVDYGEHKSKYMKLYR